MKMKYLPQALAALAMMLLVWSCAADPHIESARLALVQQDFEEVIRSAEDAIEANPENGDGYYYKGVAYASLASDKPAGQRVDDYERARENLIEARRLYREQNVTSNEAQNLDDILIETWGYEHNQGVQPLSSDIISSPEDSLRLSRHHFINATTINPDSVLSFNLLAEVNFALGNNEEAEAISRKVIYEMEQGDLYNYYRLAFFLIEDNRDEEAIELLLEARELFPDEIEIVQEIANAYLRAGKTDEALEVVQELIERDPENPQYRLVYATQVYQMVQDLDDQVRKLHDEAYDMSREIRQKAREPGADTQEIEKMLEEMGEKQDYANELIDESFRFSDIAKEELLMAVEADPENPDIHATLGIVYQNRGALMQDKRNMTEDMEEAEEFDRQAREYLEMSLPHYEKAAELEPDNTEHWLSLFRVYTNLGMTEEAERAQEKAGM
ncbi:MAG: tetratricopeptide repeat protein [Balneolaceae bacterium]|nr:MAG: tetratricopeptide repeat protein [Balneolaceae bacterium]